MPVRIQSWNELFKEIPASSRNLCWYEFNVWDLTLGIQKLQDSPNKGGMMYDSIIFFFLLYLVDLAYHKLKIWHTITSSFLHYYINDLKTRSMKVYHYQVSFQDDFMSRHDLNCNLQSVCGCNQCILNMQDCLEMIKSFLRDHHRLNLRLQPTHVINSSFFCFLSTYILGDGKIVFTDGCSN